MTINLDRLAERVLLIGFVTVSCFAVWALGQKDAEIARQQREAEYWQAAYEELADSTATGYRGPDSIYIAPEIREAVQRAWIKAWVKAWKEETRGTVRTDTSGAGRWGVGPYLYFDGSTETCSIMTGTCDTLQYWRGHTEATP